MAGPIKFLATLLLASSVSTPGAVPTRAASGPQDVESALRRELTALREEYHLPGITCAMILPDGRELSLAVGLADVEAGEPMRTDHVMPAGSIGKSFVAATVLALVADGVLDLDAPLRQWLGDRDWFSSLPNAEGLTLRRLLNHSSGITGDYLSTPQIENAFAQSLDAYGGKDLAEQGVTHEDLGRAVASTEPGFEAGKGYGYSDSNYILAGLVIEQVTGNAFYDEVRRRFLGPLGLKTIVPTARHLDHLAAGYEPDEVRLSFFPPKFASGGRLILDPAIEWTGGGFAATSRDLARWARALYGGSAMVNDYIREMAASANPYGSATQGYRYGLGVQVVQSEAYGTRLQHGGYFFGYSSFMEYLPEQGAALAFQTNTKIGYNVYREWADRLWKAADEGKEP